MLLEQLEGILSRINGCTFASIDTETKHGGLLKITTNERVILFTNKHGSGYENMVKRRLAELGKDPESFVVGDLPWGERVSGTPLIKHRGFYYLQTVLLTPGETEYFLGSMRVHDDMLASFGIKAQRTSQGLPESKQVLCHAYALDSIRGIRVLGNSLRATLSIKS